MKSMNTKRLKYFFLIVLVFLFSINRGSASAQYTFKARLGYNDTALETYVTLEPGVTVAVYDFDGSCGANQRLDDGNVVTQTGGIIEVSFNKENFFECDDDLRPPDGVVGVVDPIEGPDIYLVIRNFNISGVVTFSRQDNGSLVWTSAAANIPSQFLLNSTYTYEIGSNTHGSNLSHEQNGDYALAMCYSRFWINYVSNWLYGLGQRFIRTNPITLNLIGTSDDSSGAPGDSIDLYRDGWYRAWVIIHEYAHTVMYNFYNSSYPHDPNHPCPDNHNNETVSPPPCALREGFAEFVSSLLAPDEVGRLSIETNQRWKGENEDGQDNSGEQVEGALASIWWDMVDPMTVPAPVVIVSPNPSVVVNTNTGDDDKDGLIDSIQNVLGVFKDKDPHPQNFKDFWDGYMAQQTDVNKRQAFRKISEQNGIVYSRAKTFFTFPGQVLEILEKVPFFDLVQSVDPKLLNTPPEKMEPITNVKFKVKKRPGTTRGEWLAEPSDLLLATQRDDLDQTQVSTDKWVYANTDSVFNLLGLFFIIKWDFSNFAGGRGIYDVLVEAADENDAHDTFFPNQDNDSDTTDTQGWLRNMGTLFTVEIKGPTPTSTVPANAQAVLPTFNLAMVNWRKEINPDTTTLNPSVYVTEKCTGRRIPKENLALNYVSEPQTKLYRTELTIHDPEAAPGNHLKDNTLYEIHLTTDIKDVHGVPLDGNANGELDGPGCDKDDYCFTFYTGNIYPYLQAVELKQDEIKVCDKEPAPKESKVRYKAHWELVCGADGNIKNEFKLDVGNETVGRGLLQVKLSFPKAMNPGSLQAYLDFHGDGFDNPNDTTLIAPQLGAGATRISSDSGTWSQSNHVWNATFTLPADDPNFEDKFRDTKTRLVVYAEDTEGNKLDSNPETLNVLPTLDNPETAPAEEEAYVVVTDAATVPYTTKELKPVDKKHVFETRVLPQLARVELQKDGAPLLYTDDALCQLKSGALKPQVDEDSPVRLQFSEKLFKKKGSSIHEALTNHVKIEEWGTLITKTKARTMTEEEIKQTCDIDEAHPERKGKNDTAAGKCTGWIDLEIQTQFGIPPGELKWVAGNMPVNGKEITQVALDYSAYRSLDATPRLLRYDREYRVTVKTPSKNEDGTLNDDGLKDLNGLPFDGDKDEEMDGVSPELATVTPSEDTFAFIFKTPKPKGEHAARPPSNIPPPSTGFNKFLSFLVFGGDLCKMKLPEHKLVVKNLNRREEYMETGIVDVKVDSPVDPETKAALCEWSSAACKSTRNALENGLIPVPSDPEKEVEWGKLNIFPWDSCGSMTHTLIPSVTESRIQGREEGGCLSSDELGNCLAFGTTLPLETEAGTLDSYPEGAFPETPAAAGDGKPDESESVATNESTATWDVTHPEMLVAAAGFYKDTAGLLERFSVKKFPMDIEGIAPKLLEIGQKVVVLPSASLSGYDSSALIKTQFAEFVRGGGILVSFTQQRGFDYTVLPGGEVSAAGYLEDISCYTAGSRIDQYHPIFAGQKDTVFDGGLDGYFLTWPENAKILLRRKKNNFPALLVYPYGEGFVVASTLYTDFAGSTGQLTADETQLLKDLLVWLKNPKDAYAEAKPGESLTLHLLIQNKTQQDADSVKLTVQDNAGQTVKEETVSLSVPAGQTVPYDYIFTPPSVTGNYTVSYTLLFGTDAQVIQPQTFTESFSVTTHVESTTPDANVNFSVTSPGDLFPINSPVTFTIRVQNNSDAERRFDLSYWSHAASGPVGTVTVAAHSETLFPYTTAAIYYYDSRVLHRWRWDFVLNVRDAVTQEELRGTVTFVQGMVYVPSVTAALSLDKKSYGPSSSGTAALLLKNTSAGPFNTNVAFSIFNPNNQKIFEINQNVSFTGNEQKSLSVPFTLPAQLVPGPYTVQAAVKKEDGVEIGRTSGYFTVEKAKVAITPMLPQSIVPSSANTVSFSLQNIGQFDVNGGSLTLTAKDPEGANFFTETQPFTLNVSEQKTLSFSVPFPALQFGTYKLSYTAATERGTTTGQTSLLSSAAMQVSFTKASYVVRETMGATLMLTNTGVFDMPIAVNASAPSIGFTKTDVVTLIPNETRVLTYSASIPATASSGLQPFSVTLRLTNTQTQSFHFTIPPSRLVFSLERIPYAQGESGEFRAENKGGVDTGYSYELKLFDAENALLKTESGQGSLNAGATGAIPFTLPSSNLATGAYRLSLVATDVVLNKKVPFDAYIQVTGIGASLTTATDKKVYKTGESVNVSTTLIPTGTLSDAMLHTKIYKKEAAVETFTQLGSTASVLADGNLIWFGTAFKGAYKYDTLTKSFTNYLSGIYIRAIATDADYVYFATPSNVTRLTKQSGATKTYSVPDPTALAMDGNFLWVGSNMGLYRLEKLNEVLTHFSALDGLIDNRLSALAIDGNTLWLGFYDKGAMKYNKLTNSFSPVTLPAGTTPARQFIKAIAVDEDAVFIGTLEGVVKMDKETGAQTAYTIAEGLANNWVYALSVDGNFVWVGTWEGLSKLDKTSGTFETLTTADGLPSNYVKAIAVGKENIYFGFFTH